MLPAATTGKRFIAHHNVFGGKTWYENMTLEL
jgi:hypothetical protein